jgi:nucleotide-binding universal stress UspA family protein
MVVPLFKKILFGFAFSPSLKANAFEVMRLAHFLEAELLFVHVGNKTPQKEKQFQELLEQCETKPKKVEVHWEQGDPVDTLLESCKKWSVDLLLLGALKRENMVKFYVGSIARKLTRKAPCSVLLILHPSVDRTPCRHIVVNAFESAQTAETIQAAFAFGKALGTKKITLVEEISRSKVAVTVNDNRSLRMATLKKERLKRVEDQRVHDLVTQIPEVQKKGIKWQTQSIFGKRGYSIGHYARVVRADLVVMNAQEQPSFWGRFFPKDLEHILTELPTNVLIVQSKEHV